MQYIKRLRAINRKVRIIILSGYDRFEYAQRSARYGICAYLLKPVPTSELRDVITEVIDQIAADAKAQTLAAPAQPQMDLPSVEQTINLLSYGVSVSDADAATALPADFYIALLSIVDSTFAIHWSFFLRQASEQVFADAEIKIFDVHSDYALILCPLANRDAQMRETESLFEHLRTFFGRDHSDALKLIVGLPCRNGQEMAHSRRQISLIFEMRRTEGGIEYARDGARFVNVRTEIRKAAEYILYNCSLPLTLDDVASHVYLSPNYLSKMFKAEIGESFNSFLTRARMERAAELFRRQHRFVYQVSAMVGFKDVVNFSKLFKKYMGMMPKEYIHTFCNAEGDDMLR
ncbi:MAG: helix-turn-helix domain-containing protein [Clostridia bacterium]